MITAEVIKELNSPDIQFISGNLKAFASQVLPPEIAQKDCLAFVSKKEQLEAALAANAGIIIAAKSLTLPESTSVAFFQAGSIQLAMAAVLPLFDGKMLRFNQETRIHPLSSIHPSAHLGAGVSVGPFAVIGEGVRIGEGATIGANTVVECFAVIGDHSILHPQVFFGAHCEMGSHCEIHPHVTIGADGFSFAPRKDGTLAKLPQIGKVILGNNVEIGANCTIDRAALTVTRIGNGTKFDNLCHVAHNVVIGENCVFAAGFKIAGSSTVGSNVMVGGDAVIADHVNVGDRVVLAGLSGVTKDLPPGQYGGYPCEPLKDSLKTLANTLQLTRMRKNLARVMKHLNIQED
jgi:UDP-3-O-[3-hydroxymyristoyl] glucosamine N-acyltransferase